MMLLNFVTRTVSLIFLTVFLISFVPSTVASLFPHAPGNPLLSSSFGIPGVNATYDYIVIGGGTAGLTIATRLSSTRNLSVAIIEAGTFYEISNGNLSEVPAYDPWFTGKDVHDWQPGIDWGFVTVPQAFSNRTAHITRGKTLGGSSARNYMAYQRGTVDSFAKWAELVNDSSYLFPNVLPYYQKSPHYTPFNASLYQNATNTQSPSSFSPSGGPLQVSFANAVDAFGTWVLQLYQAFGMGLIPGFNDGALLGSAFMTSTVDPNTGIRSSSSSSFLQTALQRNLAPTIYTNTLAERILFTNTNTTTPRATGIRVTTAGTFGTPSLSYTLTARRSLILSGGAIQSPQLLLVSGIGNCTALSTLSIPCTADLPGVGHNLQDHVLFGTSHRVHLLTASASLSNATLAAEAISTYLSASPSSNGTTTTGRGPLSLPGTGVVGWEKLPGAYRAALSNTTRALLDASFPADWPEIEWLPMSALYGTGDDPIDTDPRDGSNYATLNSALVAPLSRGSVRIASAAMHVPPLIDPGWLAHPGDREVAVQAVRRQREMWGWLAAAGVAEADEYYPGEDVVSSDAELEAWLKRAASTVNHASCTCKMGTREDEMAVVDSAARVFGVEGVRVVDASSFPFLPPGHPQSTVYMLAEKIAEGILVEEGLAGDGGLSVPVRDNCVG